MKKNFYSYSEGFVVNNIKIEVNVKLSMSDRGVICRDKKEEY